MGGGIRVDTEVLRGSTFELWIPAPEAPLPRSVARSAAPVDTHVRRLSILLVEDNPVNQRVATAMLGWLGQESDVVDNGLQALESLEKKPLWVVLMDFRMAEMYSMESGRLNSA